MAAFEDWQDDLIARVPGATIDFLRTEWGKAARRFCLRTGIWKVERTQTLRAGRIRIQVSGDNGAEVCRIWACSLVGWRSTTPGEITIRTPLVEDTQVEILAALAPLQNDDIDLPQELYDQWYDGILAGALSSMHAMTGRPWSSGAMAMQESREWGGAVARATKDAYTGYMNAGLVVRPVVRFA